MAARRSYLQHWSLARPRYLIMPPPHSQQATVAGVPSALTPFSGSRQYPLNSTYAQPNPLGEIQSVGEAWQFAGIQHSVTPHSSSSQSRSILKDCFGRGSRPAAEQFTGASLQLEPVGVAHDMKISSEPPPHSQHASVAGTPSSLTPRVGWKHHPYFAVVLQA